MCIAILNPEDVTLEKSVLKTCWDNNTDGAGMLYLDGGVLKTHKEMKNFDSFYDKYLNIRKSHKDSQVVIHFRISTHGKVNETNCHPFIVNDSWGFVHNGIISNAPSHNDYSDTYMFNQEVLQKLPEDWIFNDGMYELVLGYIGSSKLLFLNTDNEAYILNEDMGVWDLGCWFSNNTYKESRYYDYGGKKVYKTAATSTITPSSTNSSFNSYKSKWAWDSDYDYSKSEWVWDYDEQNYVKKEKVSKPQSEWSDDARDQYADTCEGCDTPTTCVYSMNYNASLCKLCCSDLVAWTEEDKDERPF